MLDTRGRRDRFRGVAAGFTRRQGTTRRGEEAAGYHMSAA